MSNKKLYIAAGSVYLIAMIGGYWQANKNVSLNTGKERPDPHGICLSEANRRKAFESNAQTYDKDISNDELFMGLNILRWWHIRKAAGTVLEVGCGTGRNFSHYDYNKVKRIIAVDAVPDMLLQGMRKTNRDIVTFDVMSAQELKFPDESFDTVVDTFGLCSFDDPVAALREMSRVCKKTGKILLLEHGKGSYDWINNILNANAQHHACKWGCIYNRDINALLAEAGLKVTDSSRWHFGTTYVIEAQRADV